MKNFRFGLDERNISIIQKVGYIMYLITLLLLVIVLLYREFILGQHVDEYDDIANILVFNVIVLVAAVLYMGG